MSDVTRILSAIEQGDPQASEQLLPLVYEELRRMAAEKMSQENPGQTLQATRSSTRPISASSIVSRLNTGTVGATSFRRPPRPCGDFFIDRREKERLKRSGGRERTSSITSLPWIRSPITSCWPWMKRWRSFPRKTRSARNWSSAFFAGLTLDEAAATLGNCPAHGRSVLGLFSGVAV